jgi:hypothetical protein
MPLSPKLLEARSAILRFLSVTVVRRGRPLEVGADEEGEGGEEVAEVAWEDPSSYAVTAMPFRFFDFVTLAVAGPGACG